MPLELAAADAVALPNSTISGLDFSSQDVSASFWCRIDSSGDGGTVLGANNAAGGNAAFDLLIHSTDKIRLVLRQSSSPLKQWQGQGVTAIPIGEWVHCACTFDASGPAGRFFIDGAQVTTTVISNQAMDDAVDLGSVDLEIGRRGAGSQEFDGGIADIRIYDRLLSAGEIADLAQSKGRSGPLDALIHLPLNRHPGALAAASEVRDIANDTGGTSIIGTPSWTTGPLAGIARPRQPRVRRGAAVIAKYETPDVERRTFPAGQKWAEQGVRVVDSGGFVLTYLSSSSLGAIVRRMVDWSLDTSKTITAGTEGVPADLDHLGAIGYDAVDDEVLCPMFENGGSQGVVVVLDGTTLAVTAVIDLVAAADITRAANIDGFCIDRKTPGGPYLWAGNANYINRWDYDAETHAVTNHRFWATPAGFGLTEGLWIMSYTEGAGTRILSSHDGAVPRGAYVLDCRQDNAGADQGGVTEVDGPWDLLSRLDGGAHEEGVQVVEGQSNAEGVTVWHAELDRVARRRFVGLPVTA